jgi:hypothetical protein
MPEPAASEENSLEQRLIAVETAVKALEKKLQEIEAQLLKAGELGQRVAKMWGISLPK